MESGGMNHRLSKITRAFLLVAIAILLALLISAPQDEGWRMPLSMSSAQANSIAVAPGFIMLTVPTGPGGSLYITDTNKQVVCGYSMVGDKLRLNSARKFDFDSDILD